MSAPGTKRTFRHVQPMSASLIGRLRSSAFRLSTTPVSMSLAGSCFSSDSAPRPFQYGIRRRGGTIFPSRITYSLGERNDGESETVGLIRIKGKIHGHQT